MCASINCICGRPLQRANLKRVTGVWGPAIINLVQTRDEHPLCSTVSALISVTTSWVGWWRLSRVGWELGAQKGTGSIKHHSHFFFQLQPNDYKRIIQQVCVIWKYVGFQFWWNKVRGSCYGYVDVGTRKLARFDLKMDGVNSVFCLFIFGLWRL